MSIDILRVGFFVPMFALAPLDEALCRRPQRGPKDAQLLSILR